MPTSLTFDPYKDVPEHYTRHLSTTMSPDSGGNLTVAVLRPFSDNTSKALLSGDCRGKEMSTKGKSSPFVDYDVDIVPCDAKLSKLLISNRAEKDIFQKYQEKNDKELEASKELVSLIMASSKSDEDKIFELNQQNIAKNIDCKTEHGGKMYNLLYFKNSHGDPKIDQESRLPLFVINDGVNYYKLNHGQGKDPSQPKFLPIDPSQINQAKSEGFKQKNVEIFAYSKFSLASSQPQASVSKKGQSFNHGNIIEQSSPITADVDALMIANARIFPLENDIEGLNIFRLKVINKMIHEGSYKFENSDEEKINAIEEYLTNKDVDKFTQEIANTEFDKQLTERAKGEFARLSGHQDSNFRLKVISKMIHEGSYKFENSDEEKINAIEEYLTNKDVDKFTQEIANTEFDGRAKDEFARLSGYQERDNRGLLAVDPIANPNSALNRLNSKMVAFYELNKERFNRHKSKEFSSDIGSVTSNEAAFVVASSDLNHGAENKNPFPEPFVGEHAIVDGGKIGSLKSEEEACQYFQSLRSGGYIGADPNPRWGWEKDGDKLIIPSQRYDYKKVESEIDLEQKKLVDASNESSDVAKITLLQDNVNSQKQAYDMVLEIQDLKNSADLVYHSNPWHMRTNSDKRRGSSVMGSGGGRGSIATETLEIERIKREVVITNPGSKTFYDQKKEQMIENMEQELSLLSSDFRNRNATSDDTPKLYAIVERNSVAFTKGAGKNPSPEVSGALTSENKTGIIRGNTRSLINKFQGNHAARVLSEDNKTTGPCR